jgi:hypothetical protein
MMISRRFLISTPLFLLTGTSAFASSAIIYRNAGCGCCHNWSEMMKAAGLNIDMQDSDDLTGYLNSIGLPEALHGCHGGVMDGYVISGHVPIDDIKRLLKDRPDALGLTVIGMPSTSPGMGEQSAGEPYDVLLVAKDGSTTVFAHYA